MKGTAGRPETSGNLEIDVQMQQSTQNEGTDYGRNDLSIKLRSETMHNGDKIIMSTTFRNSVPESIDINDAKGRIIAVNNLARPELHKEC